MKRSSPKLELEVCSIRLFGSFNDSFWLLSCAFDVDEISSAVVLAEVWSKVDPEFRSDWVLWEQRDEIDLRWALISLTLERFWRLTKLVKGVLWEGLIEHNNLFFAWLLTLVKELSILACPLRPVVEALDKCDVAILELENLLDFDWDLLNIKEEVETHHISLLWVKIIKLHLNGVLNLELFDLGIILVKDETREANDWL